MEEPEDKSIESASNLKNIKNDEDTVDYPEIQETNSLSEKDIRIDIRQDLEIDDSNYKQSYAVRKNVAEGMMDIALLTANANQLRFLITYNSDSNTYYVSLVLIIISLILQITVGIGLIFRRKMKNHGKNRINRTNDLLVGGIFMITVVNVFIASFTTTNT